MSLYKKLIMNLPEISGPTQKKLPFKEKGKWTLIMLVAFFVLGMVPLYGLGESFFSQFESLQIILASSFGSIISLGIGPIVTGSIVLQLLNGSGLLKFDTSTAEGKRVYQGTQKLMSLFFVVFEAGIYVFMGGLAPNQGLQGTPAYLGYQFLLIGQLILGGVLIIFMDEVSSKWGIGSGISLFIAAGVSKEIIWKAFSPLTAGNEFSIGAVWQFFQGIMASELAVAMQALALIVSTLIVFAMAVYTQAMKVEIPLSFGRIRGHGIRWPLNFLYTSNIPVILVAALFANFQLWAQLLKNRGINFLGDPQTNTGFISYLQPPGGTGGLLGEMIKQGGLGIDPTLYLQAVVYLVAMVIGCVIFSYFWVQTAGMDARSQAKQMMSSGLQIPGFRRDQRVLERLLDRYIGPLTVMGGISIGILASAADILGALSRGTGILLAVMIIYKFYEQIAKDHMMDMHPSLRKFME
ncbi:MAG: preprotein translocase subunit SecY [Nanobdellota archaeon]